jgi:hypothetical protein
MSRRHERRLVHRRGTRSVPLGTQRRTRYPPAWPAATSLGQAQPRRAERQPRRRSARAPAARCRRRPCAESGDHPARTQAPHRPDLRTPAGTSSPAWSAPRTTHGKRACPPATRSLRRKPIGEARSTTIRARPAPRRQRQSRRRPVGRSAEGPACGPGIERDYRQPGEGGAGRLLSARRSAMTEFADDVGVHATPERLPARVRTRRPRWRQRLPGDATPRRC